MAVKIYWIHQFNNSPKLGIMARPRGDKWLEDEIINLKKQNVQIVVSLLEKDEITELGLRQEAELCLKHSIEYINFPIPDRGVPKQDNQFRNFINQLKEKIDENNSVIIHCRMGIGRSAIISGCLLLKPGYKTNEVISLISKARGVQVPDTDEQIAWLKKQE
jgi:protein-tyrosine phosphatase